MNGDQLNSTSILCILWRMENKSLCIRARDGPHACVRTTTT